MRAILVAGLVGLGLRMALEKVGLPVRSVELDRISDCRPEPLAVNVTVKFKVVMAELRALMPRVLKLVFVNSYKKRLIAPRTTAGPRILARWFWL